MTSPRRRSASPSNALNAALACRRCRIDWSSSLPQPAAARRAGRSIQYLDYDCPSFHYARRVRDALCVSAHYARRVRDAPGFFVRGGWPTGEVRRAGNTGDAHGARRVVRCAAHLPSDASRNRGDEHL